MDSVSFTRFFQSQLVCHCSTTLNYLGEEYPAAHDMSRQNCNETGILAADLLNSVPFRKAPLSLRWELSWHPTRPRHKTICLTGNAFVRRETLQ